VSLVLTADHVDAIQRHAEQTYPEECCGLLLGTYIGQERDRENRVLDVYPTPNVWDQCLEKDPEQADTTAHRRYRIDPGAMIRAQQYARANGWDIIGIYHSHPNHDAIPSEWDRAWAWPQYSYAIVSVENGTARDLQSWTLDIHHEFLPERLMVSGVTPPQVMPNLEDAI
jgi:proteasome lid subunit RPN8/RPN11